MKENGTVILRDALLNQRHVSGGSDQVCDAEWHDELLLKAPPQERNVGFSHLVDGAVECSRR